MFPFSVFFVVVLVNVIDFRLKNTAMFSSSIESGIGSGDSSVHGVGSESDGGVVVSVVYVVDSLLKSRLYVFAVFRFIILLYTMFSAENLADISGIIRFRPNVLTRNVLENEKGPPNGKIVAQPKPVIDPPANFTPKCEIKTKDTWSALNRAKTILCKQEISNVACLDKEGKLYPKSLPRYCPYKGNDTGMYFGCFRDSRAKRELGGHHKDFPETNSPSVCIAHCLQAGFQYAGVQYTKECWCGDEYGKYGLLADIHCSNHCPQNSTETCGGFLAMRVFSTGLGDLYI
eukprot:XP_014771898.1 PREDICTED: xylosyltransferase oxt-like [Octopus bimaculoides]